MQRKSEIHNYITIHDYITKSEICQEFFEKMYFAFRKDILWESKIKKTRPEWSYLKKTS